MKMTKPKNLIRFYSNPEYALQCIEERKLALIRVTKLNDPFDPAFLITDCPEVIENFDDSEKYLKEKLFDKTFVASFCEVLSNKHPKDNFYMWAHYANGHRGVAFEFDFQILENGLENLRVNGEEEPNKIHRIIYGEPPPITFDDFKKLDQGDLSAIQNKIHKQLFYKLKNWKVENEWRFLSHDEFTDMDITKINLSKDVISKIYIGLRCQPEMERKIINQTKRNFPKAKIFKAHKVRGALAIKFKEVGDEETGSQLSLG